ncbi:MAG TPA: glycosyltransferase [Candidatus Ratteibacteria bacterium]|nr:glycosyltransferase [bacterium]HRS06227.1 glycosyltransferase [Candidatus Ratteibacteria bacterium]HRV03953.1 glycosyltransferase [Candidatus Ratteibacteria bacterium]
MSVLLTKTDLVILWRDLFIGLAWFVVTIYVLSGVQDFVYDIWGYSWRIIRKFRFKTRQRLTLNRLRLREQQMIAVFIPAWKEAGVINKMLDNIIKRVEYDKYIVFVGTYPNDPDTQNAVDQLAQTNARIVKVVTSRPGPTNKADCLNHIYRAAKEYEIQNNIFFEIIVMHDAEDFVHPYSFLLYNYLIPRIDAVQLPILPLPTKLSNWVHWTYADEFSENHMKDVMVRERMQGFVPYAGVGTGFSRRFFNYMESIRGVNIFNEDTLTEDYSAARATKDAGLISIFVNLILADDKSPWYRPLCKREYFISNWAYFPFDFVRAVKQKTRWIVGIAFQEWANTGWHGNLATKENLIKDRKGFITSACNLLGYVVFGYVIIYLLGRYNIVPFKWEPIFYPGTPLFLLIIIATCFMVIRIIQRVVIVTMVYGIVPGLLAIPRLFLVNIINGIASFRALNLFLKTWSQQVLKWDKTEHKEGVGIHPVFKTEITAAENQISCGEFLKIVQKGSIQEIIEASDKVKFLCSAQESSEMQEALKILIKSEDIRLRLLGPKFLARFQDRQLLVFVMNLLYDKEWIVRANAARAVIQTPFLLEVIKDVFSKDDRYAKDIIIKTLEQNIWAFDNLIKTLNEKEMLEIDNTILKNSDLLSNTYNQLMSSKANADNKKGIEIVFPDDVSSV